MFSNCYGFAMNCISNMSIGRFFLIVTLLFFLGGCSGEDPTKLFQQGIDAMEAEKPDEAIIWFKKTLQEDPEMAMAYFKLGQIYHQKGDARQAYGNLSRAVQQDPSLKDARKEMAFILVENRALEQAVELCREYLEVNGDDEEIYLILGNALAYTKKLDEATEVMEKALAKYPESTLVKVNMAKMLVAGGKGEEGREILEKVAAENPGDVQLQMALIQVYQQLGRFDLAVMSLEQIKKDQPQIEVIVMTSFGETDLATRALQLEASDFIAKPVHDDVLFIALKRAQRN